MIQNSNKINCIILKYENKSSTEEIIHFIKFALKIIFKEKYSKFLWIEFT